MIIIRLAKTDEIQILNNLIAQSAYELSQKDYSNAEIKSAIQYVFGVDTELVSDKTYFVIEKDGEIAGCGGWSKRKTLFGGIQFIGREDSLLDPTKDSAKIRAFFIHPKFARQGLGSILLNFCEQQALINGFSSLEMMATLPGVKLYEKLGYQRVSDKVITLPNKIELKFVHMIKPSSRLTINLRNKQTKMMVCLSRQKTKCLLLHVEGKTAKMIGSVLNLSHRTVESYLKDIKNLLGCSTGSELIKLYYESKIL